jgi:hypothetical protein
MKKYIFATDENQMYTDKLKKESHAEAQRRKEDNPFAFSAPLRLSVSSSLLYFIYVHLISICG